MKKINKKIITVIAVMAMVMSVGLSAAAQYSYPHPPHNQNLTGSHKRFVRQDKYNCGTTTGCLIFVNVNEYDAYCGNCQAQNGTKEMAFTTHNRCP
ncbi:MAG: hypothetical protein FWG91_02835 [Lachnospiraceae bacterium]|nr:hypothetical protein [Lachnospiraceae bacterium]